MRRNRHPHDLLPAAPSARLSHRAQRPHWESAFAHCRKSRHHRFKSAQLGRLGRVLWPEYAKAGLTKLSDVEDFAG